MKRNVKIFCAALALVLVFGAVVGGTLAWLTAKSDQVVNTFTIGDIIIRLDESTGDEYKMIPGEDIDKDPKVTVDQSSEPCWVFVKVDPQNDVENYIDYAINSNAWTALEGYENVFYVGVDATTLETGDAEYKVLADDKVTVKDEVTQSMMADLETAQYPKLAFTAYAIQKSGFEDDVAGAWVEVCEANPAETTTAAESETPAE